MSPSRRAALTAGASRNLGDSEEPLSLCGAREAGSARWCCQQVLRAHLPWNGGLPGGGRLSQVADSSCSRISASISEAEKRSLMGLHWESLVWLNYLLLPAVSEGSVGQSSFSVQDLSQAWMLLHSGPWSLEALRTLLNGSIQHGSLSHTVHDRAPVPIFPSMHRPHCLNPFRTHDLRNKYVSTFFF